jgi:steroid delta-isomerase|tara:strand:+ start:251486 stop:251875 length:390 start_codon:yes stop_codon:yes gene_type:complete
MPSTEHMLATVNAYVDAFDRGDAEAVRDLFAPDASVEDPAGTPPKVGHQAILDFYKMSMQTGAKLKLEGPVRCNADTAAFAFSVHLEQQGQPMRIDVIDLFKFADDGKVSSMIAYFGESNMHMGAQANA